MLYLGFIDVNRTVNGNQSSPIFKKFAKSPCHSPMQNMANKSKNKTFPRTQKKELRKSIQLVDLPSRSTRNCTFSVIRLRMKDRQKTTRNNNAIHLNSEKWAKIANF